jgi:hypothetical protein
MANKTTVTISAELASRIDKMGEKYSSPSRTKFTKFLIMKALDIAEDGGIDQLIAANRILNEQRHQAVD